MRRRDANTDSIPGSANADRPETPGKSRTSEEDAAVVIAILVMIGATYGGTLVFDYGFNVETSGDHPVWHKSETDVMPGKH